MSDEKAALVIIGDTHFRDDTPICRRDDFFETQLHKLAHVCSMASNHEFVEKNAPLLIPGDVLDYWKPSPFLLARLIELFLLFKEHGHPVLVIAGQHDLPMHKMDLIHKTGLAVLEKAGAVKILNGGVYSEACMKIWGFSYGQESWASDVRCRALIQRNIVMLHTLTYPNKNPFPDAKDVCKARTLLKRLKQFDLVVVGDNHEPFLISEDNRFLLSPGSLTRQTADQIDYKPKAWLYYPGANRLECLPIPIAPSEDVISREHIKKDEKKLACVNDFVRHMEGDFDRTVSFEANLEHYWKKNKVTQDLKELVLRSLEEEDV